MAVRTYSQADWAAADRAWQDGEFAPEWTPIRDLARQRGILFPPAGTRWDGWEEDQPSQRAMLVRAIRETPELLGRCIDKSRSWSDIIRHLTGERDDWRARLREAPEAKTDRPSRREAPVLIADILRRTQP